jgi:hypothetical protein
VTDDPDRSAVVAPRPRLSSGSGLFRRLLVGLVIVVAISAIIAWFLARRGEGVVSALPAANGSFGSGGTIPFGPFDGRFSPDGSKLLVLSADSVSIATGGRLTQLNEDGDEVLDAAWMPGSNAILVAYGPVGSDRMLVLDLGGRSLGSIKLNPPVAIAADLGMAVAPNGRTAVVTTRTAGNGVGAVDKVGLARVDLGSGAVDAITPRSGDELSHPVWFGNTQLLVDVGRPGAVSRAAVLDLATSVARPIDAPSPNHGIAVLRDGTIVLAVRHGRTEIVNRLEPGGMSALGRTGTNTTALDVDGLGRLGLVVDETTALSGAVRLRRVVFQPASSK